MVARKKVAKKVAKKVVRRGSQRKVTKKVVKNLRSLEDNEIVVLLDSLVGIGSKISETLKLRMSVNKGRI